MMPEGLDGFAPVGSDINGMAGLFQQAYGQLLVDEVVLRQEDAEGFGVWSDDLVVLVFGKNGGAAEGAQHGIEEIGPANGFCKMGGDTDLAAAFRVFNWA